MSKALFIVFEGIDGSGTTTQTQRLGAYIKAKGIEVVSTREPGGTPLAERIRQLVLDPLASEMHHATELFLYAASRAQHIHELIRPALSAEKPVICDRFSASTLAYQGSGRGLDPGLVKQVAALAAQDVEPDLTILLDLPLAEALRRRSLRQQQKDQQEDRLELAGNQFQQRVAQGYRQIAAQDTKNYLVLDASVPADQLEGEVLHALCQRWPHFPYKVE